MPGLGYAYAIIPNTSLREAAPTTSLRDALRVRSVQVPNAQFKVSVFPNLNLMLFEQVYLNQSGYLNKVSSLKLAC